MFSCSCTRCNTRKMMIWAKLARLTKHHILKPIDHIETAGDANEASRTLPKRNETEKKQERLWKQIISVVAAVLSNFDLIPVFWEVLSFDKNKFYKKTKVYFLTKLHQNLCYRWSFLWDFMTWFHLKPLMLGLLLSIKLYWEISENRLEPHYDVKLCSLASILKVIFGNLDYVNTIR